MADLELEIPYGSGYQSAKIPERQLLAVVKPDQVEPLHDFVGAIREALQTPTGVRFFRSLMPWDTIAIVIDDKTRPVPNKELLHALLEELLFSGIKPENVKIVIATGVHSPCGREDLDRMLGPEIVDRFPPINHSASDDKELAYVAMIGEDKSFQLRINRSLAEAKIRILTGVISPHHAAGYSGGRKSILPGVASFENIKKQHGIRPDRIMIGKLTDNPFHTLAMEAAEKVGVHFIINVVLNHQGQVAKVVAGDLVRAWEEGVAFCDKVARVMVPECADIVVTSPGGYPRDINLWQSQKAISTAELIVKPGGVIVLVAECREGVGSQDLENWLKAASSPQEIIERFNQLGFTGGSRKAYYFARALQKVHLIVVSDRLSKDTLKGMLLTGAGSVKEGLEMARERIAGSPFISVLPSAPGLIVDVGRPC